MKYAKYISLLALMFVLSSCYHAQITTDQQASTEVIDKPWAHSFVFGLVPPAEINTASQCPNGVARVETKISFLNGLVSAITFSLYTPMHITVTCAESSAEAVQSSEAGEILTLSKKAGEKEVRNAISRASELAVVNNQPVYVNFY